MATNRERITKLQTTLAELEKQAQLVEKKIDQSKTFVETISSHANSTSQWKNEVEQSKNQTTAAFEEAGRLKDEIDQVKQNLNKELSNTEVKKDEIDKFFIQIFGEENKSGRREGGLKDKLSKREKEIDTFLAKQEKQYRQLFKKIESLLTGATSIGLAKAYHDQRDSYKWPNRIWATVFIVALFGIVLMSYLGFEEAVEVEKALSKLAARAPFYFAFIWLAGFSSKQYRQNKRLEQEYAHKEVLARSYQGYKVEFESQSKTASDKEMSTNLKKILVEAIRRNPSEIIDDGKKDDTPSVLQKPINEIFSFGGDKK